MRVFVAQVECVCASVCVVAMIVCVCVCVWVKRVLGLWVCGLEVLLSIKTQHNVHGCVLRIAGSQAGGEPHLWAASHSLSNLSKLRTAFPKLRTIASNLFQV